MITRTITWTVGDDLKATPTALQNAGIQGEHEATEVVFRLPDRVKDYNLYLEYLGGDGLWDTTAALPYDAELGGLSFLLPRAWTRGGGAATLRLVLEQPAADVLQPPVRYTVPVRIRYADREVECGEEKRFLEQNVHRILSAGERAVNSATEAEAAKETAATAAASAKDSAERAREHERTAGLMSNTAREAKDGAIVAQQAAEEAKAGAEVARDTAERIALAAEDAATVAQKANEAAGRAASNANTSTMQAQTAAIAAKTAEVGAKEHAETAEEARGDAIEKANLAALHETGAKDAAEQATAAAEEARGQAGKYPYIGENGNWYIEETDTGIKATGKDGGYYVVEIVEVGETLRFIFTPSKEEMGTTYSFSIPKPKDGKSGVYVGSGDMPEGYNVQVDPEGDVVTVEEIAAEAAALIPPPKDGQDGKSAYQYAKEGGYTGTEAEFAQKIAREIPTKTSDITNDSGFITDVPVKSVNGKTGAVSLSAEDVGARPATWTPTYTDVGADKSGTAGTAVYAHNTQTEAHSDIRLLISELSARLDALANSDDDTLDQMAEVVAYIKDNRGLIEQITTGKVSVADIVNNLTTNVTNKPLSAAQGVALKALIDEITVPTKLSELTADATHRLVTDAEKTAWNAKSDFSGKYADLSGKPTIPTVPSWATAASKPSYTKSEVGLGNVDNVKQYSESNPPPYPVTSVNGKTGAVTVSVPTKTSQLTNDSNFADTTKAETWTFTLEDGSTVTKKVVLA